MFYNIFPLLHFYLSVLDPRYQLDGAYVSERHAYDPWRPGTI